MNQNMDVDSTEPQVTQRNGGDVHMDGQLNVVSDNGKTGAPSPNGCDATSPANGNEQGGEDSECRSEGVLRLRIEQFTKGFKESALGPAIVVRNLPWRILAIPKQHVNENRQTTRALGFFVQCNGDSETAGWSCYATAELRIIAQKPGCENVVKRVSHVFYPKENDWGFANFMTFSEIMDSNRGLLKDDTLILEAYVQADPPHGVQWDSKKLTGFVGLRNQGATCYMNSLLQTLFFTNRLRQSVYQMPTDNDDPQRSVPFALQRVFHDLQFNDRPVGTKKLTRSFGWETLDSFMQHDVQELCRVLLDNLENKMKGTCVEGTIADLFEGKMESYIRCKNVEYTSARVEKFYDVQLNVKGKNSVYDSFDDYVAVELLDGVNKYDAGRYGLQEAEKGVIFLQFPPVLHLQLMRFQYDPNLDVNVKINDRFEFPERLDLSRYLKQPQSQSQANNAIYLLQAVLVHSGDNHGGHYVVYLSPRCDGQWFRFDDDVVSRSTRQEATVYNYGGSDEEWRFRSSSNAYMLVYINEAKKDFVMPDIQEEHIPEILRRRLEEEKRIEERRKKERQEAHLYMDLTVFTRETFETNHGYDLFEQERLDMDKRFSVRKASTIRELTQQLATAFGLSSSLLRIWPIVQNEIGAYRPSPINRRVLAAHNNQYDEVLVSELVEPNDPMLYVWLEVGDSIEQAQLAPYNRQQHLLLFLKRYELFESQNYYAGHVFLPQEAKVSELAALCCDRAHYPTDTPLRFWIETVNFGVHPVPESNDQDSYNLTLSDWLAELGHYYAELARSTDARQPPPVVDTNYGFVIVFQKATNEALEADAGVFPTVRDFYQKDVSQRIRVAFVDKMQPHDDGGFVLELNARWNYDQMCKAVARHLGVDPYKLAFSRSLRPDQPIKFNFEGNLRDLLQIKERYPATANNTQNRNARRLFYQLLSVRINELENKHQVKCIWVSPKLKEEQELILYPDRGGIVRDLLNEARRHLRLTERGSGMLRLLEVVGCRIQACVPEDAHLDKLLEDDESPSRILRVEEIPLDELPQQQGANASDTELVISCAHFHKDAFITYGVPFTVKIRHGDKFTQIRERIQKKLDVTDREIEKWRFCIVHNARVQYVETNEQQTYTVNLHDMKALVKHGWLDPQRFWLGLDHLNKQQRRTRYSCFEKSIKIHN